MAANNCNRCGIKTNKARLAAGKYWCDFCFEQQSRETLEADLLPRCELCEEEMLANTSYRLLDASICMHCLLRLGPERVQTLIKVKQLERSEIETAVGFIRKLLNRNQRLRLREAIYLGGKNWWVKLPAFGEYVCRNLLEKQIINWDPEVLEEVWDRLIEEAVEE